MIKVPRFGFGTPGEWIIIVNQVQKSLAGQNVDAHPSMYASMKRLLKGDAKAEFLQQASLVRGRAVPNFLW